MGGSTGVMRVQSRGRLVVVLTHVSTNACRMFGCGAGAGGRAEHVAFRRQARAYVDDKEGDGGNGDETQAMLQALREERATIDGLYDTVNVTDAVHPSRSQWVGNVGG
jgi:hypothetical protein